MARDNSNPKQIKHNLGLFHNEFSAQPSDRKVVGWLVYNYSYFNYSNNNR